MRFDCKINLLHFNKLNSQFCKRNRLDEEFAHDLELDWDAVRHGVGGPLFTVGGESERALQEQMHPDPHEE